jgi:hypothetical protein
MHLLPLAVAARVKLTQVHSGLRHTQFPGTSHLSFPGMHVFLQKYLVVTEDLVLWATRSEHVRMSSSSDRL